MSDPKPNLKKFFHKDYLAKTDNDESYFILRDQNNRVKLKFDSRISAIFKLDLENEKKNKQKTTKLYHFLNNPLKRCDFIIYYTQEDKLHALLVDFKGKNVKNTVIEQIQLGAIWAEHFIKLYNQRNNTNHIIASFRSHVIRFNNLEPMKGEKPTMKLEIEKIDQWLEKTQTIKS